jgi:hypothetical protein
MVEGRPSHLESNGAGQAGRQEDRQGIEALTRRNQRDGSKARDILEYAGINREDLENAFGFEIHPVADFLPGFTRSRYFAVTSGSTPKALAIRAFGQY